MEPTQNAADKRKATQKERANREVEAQKHAPGDRAEERAHQPMSRESKTEAPDSSPAPIQLLSPSLSFEKTCAPTQASTVDSGCLNHLPYDQLRDVCKHGYRRQDAEEVLKTRLASTQDQRARRTRELPMGADTPVTGAVKRDRPPADAAEHLQGATFELDERC